MEEDSEQNDGQIQKARGKGRKAGRERKKKKERKNIPDHFNFKAIQPSTSTNNRMLHLQGQPRCYYSNISKAYISAA